MIVEGLKNIYFFILPTFFLLVGLKLSIGKSSLPKRILGIFFLFFFLRIIAAYFLEETNFGFSIHFYKIQSIIFYIIPPLGYLLFLYALEPFRKFKYIDLLHFLPALFHFIELVPFLFGPAELKFRDLAIAKSTPNFSYDYPSLAGVLPIKFHFYGKLFSHLVYYTLSAKVWYKYAKVSTSIFYKNNKILIRWIGADILLKFISLFIILSKGLGFAFFQRHRFLFLPSDYLMLLDALFHFVFFLYYPHLLNGSIFERLRNSLNAQHVSKNEKAKTKLIRKLQFIMEVETPFLQEDFTIKKLAARMQISERNLSKCIHENFQKSFPDYLGELRLNYMQKILMEEKNNSALTLEMLAENSGFGSRQALYKVVQRLHQKTPGKYFDEIIKNKNLDLT